VVLQTTSPLNNDFERDIHTPSEHFNIVRDLSRKNKNIFANKDSDLSQTDTVTINIPTGNHPPIRLRPYRTPLNNRKFISDAIDEMLEANIIRRSHSPYSFPVVVVGKKRWFQTGLC
jgi:hypothetical protein